MKISVSFTRYERNLYDKARNQEDVSRYIKSLIRKDLESNTNTLEQRVSASESTINSVKTVDNGSFKKKNNISSFI